MPTVIVALRPKRGRERKLHVYICAGCNVEFMAPKYPCRKFCSRECAFAYEKIHGRDWITGWHKRRDAEAVAKLKLSVERDCRTCGRKFSRSYGATTVFCSDDCRREQARKDAVVYSQRCDKRDRAERSCAECSKGFAPEYGNKKRLFCSKECLEAKSNRVGKSVRRARQRSAVYEMVDPLEICERDGWRCHLCRHPTPKRLRGSHCKRAPEVDHIIPLAAGGTHTRDNMACCCRQCNQAKGALPLGQMRLALGIAPMSTRGTPIGSGMTQGKNL